MLFFAVQMLFIWYAEQKKFECAVQNFAASWREFCRSKNFCRLMAQVLPPYGPVLINRAQYKSLLLFLGGGVCKSLS